MLSFSVSTMWCMGGGNKPDWIWCGFSFPASSWLLDSALFALFMAIAVFLSTPGLPQLFYFLIAVLTFHYSHYFVSLALSGVQARYLYYWPDNNSALCSFGLLFSTFALPQSGCLLLQHTGCQALLYVVSFLELFCLIL